MTITLYGLIPYDRSAKSRWLLEEAGASYENHWLDTEKGEREGEAYLKINPLGRVPAVMIDGRPLIESSAICAYLADRYIEQGLAPALSAPERLDYQQWMYFAAATLDPFGTRISIIEDIPPGEVFEKKSSEFLSEVRETVAFIEQTLSRKEYLAGRFSAADICVGYHLYFCALWPEMQQIIADYPRTLAYLERLKQRPAAVKAKVFSYVG